MSVNSSPVDGAAPALVKALKEVLLDAQFKQGLLEATQTAGRALSRSWAKHGGTEALLDLVRNTFTTQR